MLSFLTDRNIGVKLSRFSVSFGMAIWLLTSLIAIALLDQFLGVALGIAILSGAFIGVGMHRVHSSWLLACSAFRTSNESVRLLNWSILSLIGINYGWFVFTDRPPTVGLLILGVLFAFRAVHMRRLVVVRTPHDLFITLLVFLALLSGLIFSVDLSLSLPKVYGFVLSVLLYRELAHKVSRKRDSCHWLVALSGLGIGIAALGLLGTDWFSAKLLNLADLYSYIPRIISDIPRSIQGGFHPNGIAGTLIFVIPVYASQLGNAFQGGRNRLRDVSLSSILAFFAAASTITVLLLTQSRGALLGLVVVLIVLFFAWKRRWSLSLVALTGSLLLLGVLLVYFPTLFGTFEVAQVTVGQKTLSSLEFRLAVWDIALRTLRVFPFTGVGIGTFDDVARYIFPHLYPVSSLHTSSYTITHAHNEFLQVAIDLGIPGFVAYVALWAGFARTTWRVYTWAADEETRRLVLGIAAGLLAHQIFGLTDAFMLGTKPGIVMWILMGLITGMYLNLAPKHLRPEHHEQQPPSHPATQPPSHPAI